VHLSLGGAAYNTDVKAPTMTHITMRLNLVLLDRSTLHRPFCPSFAKGLAKIVYHRQWRTFSMLPKACSSGFSAYKHTKKSQSCAKFLTLLENFGKAQGY
jgi:hypothetical protein